MSVRIAYGDRADVSGAISSGVIPDGSVIIAKNGEMDTELLFYDPASKLKKIVQTTRFKSEQDAISYAHENDMTGRVVTVQGADDMVNVYVVLPDFSLLPIGISAPASSTALGGVKSSNSENGISVSADGTMTVNEININRLTQDDGEEILFVCGSSTG